MTTYERLGGAASPTTPRRLEHNQSFGSDSPELEDAPPRSQTLFTKLFSFGYSRSRKEQQRPYRPVSNYLTLIPLSDERLKPRRTKQILTLAALFTVAATCAVFFLVPRGISLGAVTFSERRMCWNDTESTYQLLLDATLPISNDNYMRATVTGELRVMFFDQEACNVTIQPTTIRRRVQSQNVTVQLDASDMPHQYKTTIYAMCRIFPQKVIFFVSGQLKATCMGKVYNLPRIDTYFMISCENGKDPSCYPPPPPDEPPPPPPPEPSPDPEPSADPPASEPFLQLPEAL